MTATWTDTNQSLDRLRFEVWSFGHPFPSAEGPQPLAASIRVGEGVDLEENITLVLTTANNPAYPIYTEIALEDQPVHFDLVETYRC